MAKESKKAYVFRTMNENADKPMVEVLPLLMAPFGWDEATAKSYYLWAVRKGFAQGQAPAGRTRKPKAAKPKAVKTKEVPAKKLLKEVGIKTAPAPVKSDAEIAKIKAANLARLKAVSAKTKKYTSVAKSDGPGVKDFDADEARAEVEEFKAELDSFKAPRFLKLDEVKALV